MSISQTVKTYHLSHIDLDGYSCQLITSELFNDIIFFNANYGEEVKSRLLEILDLIDAEDKAANILISDLNLTLNESKFLDEAIKQRREKAVQIELLLLDHHGSGKESATIFSWYKLDVTRCATKIVYEYALKYWGVQDSLRAWLASFVDVVNAVDLWLMHEYENFEYGKVCLKLISESRELNRYIFDKENRAYKFALLKKAAHMVGGLNEAIALDEKIHNIKKLFFKEDKDNTLDALATAYIVRLIKYYKKEFTINYRGHKGILTFCLGNTSIIGNGILQANNDIDFVIDVGNRGTLSLRADNKINVSILAKELVNGGGHPNASGGRMKNFRDKYLYKDVKKFMDNQLSLAEVTSSIPLNQEIYNEKNKKS